MTDVKLILCNFENIQTELDLKFIRRQFEASLRPSNKVLGGVKSNLLDRQNALLLQKSLWCLAVRSYLGRHTKFQCDTGLSFVLTADCC